MSLQVRYAYTLRSLQYYARFPFCVHVVHIESRMNCPATLHHSGGITICVAPSVLDASKDVIEGRNYLNHSSMLAEHSHPFYFCVDVGAFGDQVGNDLNHSNVGSNDQWCNPIDVKPDQP